MSPISSLRIVLSNHPFIAQVFEVGIIDVRIGFQEGRNSVYKYIFEYCNFQSIRFDMVSPGKTIDKI